MTIHPYFKVSEGNLGAFKELCERFVSTTSAEPKCLYYGFSFNGDEVFCREGYADAAGLLTHLDNVGALLAEALNSPPWHVWRFTASKRSWPNFADHWPI